jgi:uncharacterized membrane protein
VDSVKRFPFLDWMRGLAVVIMIQCHTFNSFTRLDLREGGAYVLTQFIGGMAAPLFLLMAGMTTAFQMESLERREPTAARRWMVSLRRAGYILAIAFTFRFTNWLFSIPHAGLGELTKVDILNCMGVGMAVLAVGSVFRGEARIRFAVCAGLGIAALAPVMSNLPWGNAPALLREYLVPGGGRGRFPFFPCAAYIAFGQAIGAVVKRTAAERFERLMQWSMLVGFAMVFIGQYFSNIPYSVYPKADFWTDSPALIVIRVGICLMIMAAAYLWTEYGAGAGWSWMQVMGKNSLQVYWVHVMIVYGSLVAPLKRAFSIPLGAMATVAVTAAMMAMSVLWLGWKDRRAAATRPQA